MNFFPELNFEKEPVPFPAPQFSESYIIYSLKKLPDRKLFDNERIGIRPEEMNRLLTLDFIIKQKLNGNTAACYICRER